MADAMTLSAKILAATHRFIGIFKESAFGPPTDPMQGAHRPSHRAWNSALFRNPQSGTGTKSVFEGVAVRAPYGLGAEGFACRTLPKLHFDVAFSQRTG
jgi:hypothetical protein